MHAARANRAPGLPSCRTWIARCAWSAMLRLRSPTKGEHFFSLTYLGKSVAATILVVAIRRKVGSDEVSSKLKIFKNVYV